MTLKLNRHGSYTRGLAITNNTNGLRFCFFELDLPLDSDQHERVDRAYTTLGLDYLKHRTGNGWHWISPTLVDKATWKKLHEELKDLNPKCPMTTLRIEPNKYPNEQEIWYISDSCYCRFHDRSNSLELANQLNRWFDSKFEGTIETKLKFVRYPLP